MKGRVCFATRKPPPFVCHRWFVSASDDKTVKIFDASNCRFHTALSGHSNWVRSARISDDGRMAVSGSDDKTVKTWDVRSRETAHTYYDHSDTVTCVRFHPDSSLVAACGADKSIKLWDIRSNKLLQVSRWMTHWLDA